MIILSGFAGRLYGQETDIINDMAGERIYVSASSATVLEWFDCIEKETGITLSYNPSMIELDRQCRVPLTGNITVGRLLGIVLADYKYKISSIAPKKLVISIVRRKNFYISGSVSDADSREKLYGAVIMLEDSVGQKIYSMADDGHESYSEEEWDDTFPDDGFEMPQDRIVRNREHINQFSIFYDNNIRITDNLHTQVGVHFVGYLPKGHKDYYSIQPRFSLRYTPTENNLFYFNFSKMEQFYHYLRFSTISLPTDFRMPSIGSYKPRESEHYEIGWKHFLRSGFAEVSLYYKTRRNVLAIKPETFIEDTSWDNYLMSGNGESYGLKMYYFGDWKKWSLQASYTYSRSKEWFALLEDRGKMPSLYDIPHQLGCALSYKLNRNSTFSAGIIMNSGKVIEITDDWDLVSTDNFRKGREKMNYRVDAGYVYRKSFGDNLLLLRLGLYNVVGNPSEEDILNFYSVHWYNHCLPYAGISFKF